MQQTAFTPIPKAIRGSGPRAGFWPRFGAALLDALIVGLTIVLLTALAKAAGYLVGLALGAAYYTVLEGGRKGQTVGKSALGIRVISFSTGGPVGYGPALGRYFARILSSLPLYLGYFWMLWDSEARTWHDQLSGSVVVPVAAYPITSPSGLEGDMRVL